MLLSTRNNAPVLARRRRRRRRARRGRRLIGGKPWTTTTPSSGMGDASKMSKSMRDFAEEGYPSEEDDIKDPRERDRAMKEAVGDVLDMARSEADVINQAYDLIEKLSPGMKMKNRPPRREEKEEKEEE